MATSNKFIVCANDRNRKSKLDAALKDFVGSKVIYYPEISLSRELRDDPAHKKYICVNFDETEFKGLLMVREVRILYPQTRFIAIKSHWQEKSLLELLNHKVNGVATWNCSVEDIKYMIRSVVRGNSFVSCDLMNSVYDIIADRSKNGKPNSAIWSKLSNQEKNIIKLMISGLSPREISVHLNVKYETVRSHLKNIYRKLEVNSMLKAVVKILKSDPDLL